MSAGTLTLTNNSASVSGSGTSFTTELAAADFIVVTVGGIPYTLPVKTVDSTTALTLVSNYTGPTQAGAAWYAVPRVAMNLVTAALVAQSAEALRGLNYDKQNWQQIFAGSGTATVKLPDDTSFTGPTWNSLATSLASKADKTALDGKADKSSLGGAAALNVGTAANTVAAGNDSRFFTIDGRSGGTLQRGTGLTIRKGADGDVFSSPLVLMAQEPVVDGVRMRGSYGTFAEGTDRVILNIDSLTAKYATVYASGGVLCQNGGRGGTPTMNSYHVNWTGSQATVYIDSYLLGAISFVGVSDRELKKEIQYLKTGADDLALAEVVQWKLATFRYKKRGIIPESSPQLGIIANDLIDISPDCVTGTGLESGADLDNPTNAYNLDDKRMFFKLVLAVQAQQKKISELQSLVKQLSVGS
ncbi:tail fiber domain-containing protein [Kosakonia sacchari]|uniref:tail fiber domain-containing protein n=1 Tax=Kosakonia sacchari TaxID=1158459 RepID=UPI002ACED1C8|nr:tail fiber domain-containing protein [Kosakonia sacchari]MDZ7322027.1 tail fiber domain-containing protein [Kosakonia sacchari]